MELRNITYFLRIVETGSLSKAAESLYLTQPTLSRFLSKLEDELGVTLFRRSKSTALELTEAGQKIAVRARKLQEQYFSALYRGVSEEEFAAWKRFIATVYENICQLDGALSIDENLNKD